MAYRNYDRGGYDNYGRNNYPRNRYPQQGGYPPQGYQGGYPQQGGYPPQMPEDRSANFPFKIGDKVIHKATGTELFVVNYGREQLECRMPDLRTDWFYVHELELPDAGK